VGNLMALVRVAGHQLPYSHNPEYPLASSYAGTEAAVSRHDGKALANHTLRKTFAMRIYDGTQHNIFLTSKALGHASIDMTQKYLGISDEEVAAAILLAA
jgi:integrase